MRWKVRGNLRKWGGGRVWSRKIHFHKTIRSKLHNINLYPPSIFISNPSPDATRVWVQICKQQKKTKVSQENLLNPQSFLRGFPNERWTVFPFSLRGTHRPQEYIIRGKLIFAAETRKSRRYWPGSCQIVRYSLCGADAALVVASRQPDDKSLEFAYFSLESFEGRAAGGSVVSIVSIVIGHEGQNISEISSKISIFLFFFYKYRYLLPNGLFLRILKLV